MRRDLGTTADSSTASCSMRADSTSKGPEASKVCEIKSIERLFEQNWNTTYSVARGYDEVVSTREEPEVSVLEKKLRVSTRALKETFGSTRKERSPHLALLGLRWGKNHQQSSWLLLVGPHSIPKDLRQRLMPQNVKKLAKHATMPGSHWVGSRKASFYC